MNEWFTNFLKINKFKYIDRTEKKKYDVGIIRAHVKFVNNKECDITIIGHIEEDEFYYDMHELKGYYFSPQVVSAQDKLHKLLEGVEDKSVSYIVGDNLTYYNLNNNLIDEIVIMHKGSHEVEGTVYIKTEKVKRNE